MLIIFFYKGNATKCGEYEEYNSCMNPCQSSCENPKQQPCKTTRCSGGCVCIRSYLHATNQTTSPCVKNCTQKAGWKHSFS